MDESLLCIDEPAARAARPTDLLADRTNDRKAGSSEPAWFAVGSMALGVFSLVTAEFLPANLLTPIAADFRISEGAAGQTVTATAAFALLSSLLVTAVIRNLDRRILMLGFTILLLISNLIAAFALNLPMLLVGRVLLGAALGGFWTMSAALAMRLVPEASVPRALSIIFSGVSAATIFAFFTYLRPFLEFTTGAGIAMISSVLLGFGVANLLGTVLAGFMLERSLRASLASMPVVMAVLAACLATINGAMSLDLALIALWGMAFGAVPVAWSTWLTRTVPDEAESAGGLLVAAIQLAITIGAAGGGVIYDFKGATAVFGASSVVLFVAAAMAFILVPTRADEAA
jgi:predicted MFS family arabinose efflux permease